MGRTLSLPVVFAALAFGLVAAPAAADYHLEQINEVMLSTGGNGGAQFVELLESVDENFPLVLAPYRVVVYDAGNTRLGAHEVSQPLLAGRDNTQPLLIATAAAQAALGVVADETLTVALPSTGKVCFTQGTGENPLSCLSWQCHLDGQSLQRVNIASSTFVLAAPTAKAANASTGAAQDSCMGPPTGTPTIQPGGGPPTDPGPGGTGTGTGTGGGGGGGTIRDTIKPSLSKIALSAKELGLTVSEAGTVTVTIERKTKKGFKRVKRLSLTAKKSGALKTKLPTLSAAVYRITIVAKDAAGNVSKTTTRTLTVKPKKK
jgi:hypothetical protein